MDLDCLSRWIQSPETFNSANDIGNIIKLYTNVASNGDWNRAHDRHTKMVAMVAELKKEQQKNRGNRNPLKNRITKKACVGDKAARSGTKR